LKLKKDDRLIAKSTFWARIQPETFFRVQPEPGSQSSARFTTPEHNTWTFDRRL